LNMAVILPVLLAFILLSLGVGLVIWYAFRQKLKNRTKMVRTESKAAARIDPHFTFKWRYVIVPLIILVITIVAIAYFYHLLPLRIAYSYSDDVSGDRWTSKTLFVAIMLIPQILLTLAGAAIAMIVANVGRRFSQDKRIPAAALPSIITVMSNMVVLPQLILCFAMLDIFSYNAYQIHLLSLYVFIILVMLVGGLMLAFLFYRAIRQTRIAR
jgi:uncharacterized membrane protein